MKIKTLYLFFLVVSLFLFSCSSKQKSEGIAASSDKSIDYVTSEAEMQEETSVSPDASSEKKVLSDRKLIKEGSLSFETDDISKTTAFIKRQLRKNNGYISNENEEKFTNSIHKKITVRIPSEKFDAFIDSLSSTVEDFDTKEINVVDVTENFVDVEARLQSKKETEKRYLALLEKANTISEIIEIQEKLDVIREETESLEARYNSLSNSIAYSTINIDIYKEITDFNNYTTRLADNFVDGWDGLLSFFLFCLSIWPFFIFLAISIVVLVLLIKRSKKRKLRRREIKEKVD